MEMEQELIEIVRKVVETGMETIPPALMTLEWSIRVEGIVQLLIALFLAAIAGVLFRIMRKAKEDHVQGLSFIGMSLLGIFSILIFAVDYPLVKVISPLGWLLRRVIVGG